MPSNRQSVTLTELNDSWLTAQTESGEFNSKSEVINDLIRQARRHEAIRKGLEKAEQSIEQHGYSDKTAEQRLAAFKQKARQNGQL